MLGVAGYLDRAWAVLAALEAVDFEADNTKKRI